MLLLSLTACWNSKDLQNMAYVTALGLDYEDGKYVTYVQVLNFTNVAKGEKTEVGKNVPTWIGRGEGVTLTESFNSIYATAQLRVFWGHVKAIVATERFLRNGQRFTEAYDKINRTREIRYNVLVYGTKESMRDVFSQKSNLNMSPLETLLDTPRQAYSQRSHILPRYGFKLIAQFREPEGTTLVPSIALDKHAWTEDKTPKSMFKINGVYFYHKRQYQGWLPEHDMEGYRWVQESLEESPIDIKNNNSPAAAISLLKPKARIQVVPQNGNAVFNLKVSMQAYVSELVSDLSKKEIERLAAQAVEKQIRATYEKGVTIKADIFNLSNRLYRDHPKLWRDLHKKEDFILDKASLNRIVVKVNLKHTGKYKLRVE